MHNISIPITAILEIFPEAINVKNLPRKKKKALKKKLGIKTSLLLTEILEDNNHLNKN